jgi:hypothetical protein
MRAWAKGVLAAEAAVELLIGHRWWLHRADFAEVAVEPGRNVFTGTVVAAVGFQAAAAALEAGALPCSSGEGQVLRIAASIAAGVPVDLREAVTGLDAGNAVLVAEAVLHAAGHRGAAAVFGSERW